MATLSYSFHISSKKNAITNKQKLSRALNHNLRSYDSKEFDKKQNLVLIGSNNSKNAFEDFKNFYDKEFGKELQEYNSNQKREDRKIKSYFDTVSNNSKTDLATEIIIQVGDMEFWKDKTMDQKKQMTEIFKNQLELLNKNCNDFKVVNAVIHYDEKSPHIQIIGVPVAEYKNGLKKRVAKTKVFTKESLEMLQDKMREPILAQMQKIYGKDINLEAKSQGRNQDLLIKDYIKAKEEINSKIDYVFNENTKRINNVLVDSAKNVLQGSKNDFKTDSDIKVLKTEIQSKKQAINELDSVFSKSKALEKAKNTINELEIALIEKTEKNIKLTNQNIILQKTIENTNNNNDFFIKNRNKEILQENELLKKENKELKHKEKIIKETFKTILPSQKKLIDKIFELGDNEKKKIYGFISDRVDSILNHLEKIGIKFNNREKDRTR